MLRGRGMGWANRGPARLRGTRAERNPPARFPEASRLQGRGTCWRGQAVPCSSRGYYREHSRVAVRPGRVGAAGVLSLDVHAGPPGLRSLRVRCASPSLASLAPTARSRPPAAPPRSRMADVNDSMPPAVRFLAGRAQWSQPWGTRSSGQDAAPNAGLHGDRMSPTRKSRSGHEAALTLGSTATGCRRQEKAAAGRMPLRRTFSYC